MDKKRNSVKYFSSLRRLEEKYLTLRYKLQYIKNDNLKMKLKSELTLLETIINDKYHLLNNIIRKSSD